MKLTCLFVATLIALAAAARAEEAEPPRVVLETSKGEIVLELDPEKAPLTVASFLETVRSGFYDGTVFHRVIPGFMIQGGGFEPGMRLKTTTVELRNEADNGLQNVRGSIAMARKPDPHSASTQFFVNLVDNPALDHKGPTPAGWGYAVFGRVVGGMEVVDAIAAVPTGRVGGFRDVPREDVVVVRAVVVGDPTTPSSSTG